MLAQLAFPPSEDLVVPLEHVHPGVDGGAARLRLSEKLWHEFVGDTHVICVAEIVLQPLQCAYKLRSDILIEQGTEELDRVTELLGGDPQLVPLRRRQLVEAFTTMPYSSQALIEDPRRDLADRRGQRIAFFARRATAPATHLEPTQQAQDGRRELLGQDFFPDPGRCPLPQPVERGRELLPPRAVRHPGPSGWQQLGCENVEITRGTQPGRKCRQ